jgi:hypothetical protein
MRSTIPGKDGTIEDIVLGLSCQLNGGDAAVKEKAKMRVHGIGKNGDDEADPFALVRRKLPTSLRVDYFVGAFLDSKELPDRALDISRIGIRGMLDRLGFFLLWFGGLRLGSAVRAAKAEKSADENERQPRSPNRVV